VKSHIAYVLLKCQLIEILKKKHKFQINMHESKEDLVVLVMILDSHSEGSELDPRSDLGANFSAARLKTSLL
jgi:hypothetical protein